MADDILPIQPRVEAVKARLPQIMAGLDTRRQGPLPETPAAFRLAPATTAEPPQEPARQLLDPSRTQPALLRRFSSSLPVAPPAEIETPTRSSESATGRVRRDVEDIGEKQVEPAQPRVAAGAPGAAYHAETTIVSGVATSTTRGAEPAPLERRHSLALIAPAVPREPVLRKGGIWMTLLIGVGFAALILLR